MPQTCAVPLCKVRSGSHKFPRDSELLNAWLVAIRRKKYEPTANSIVCRKHFRESDYVLPKTSFSQTPKLVLKKDAIPSKFSWSDSKHVKNMRQLQRIKMRDLKKKKAKALNLIRLISQQDTRPTDIPELHEMKEISFLPMSTTSEDPLSLTNYETEIEGYQKKIEASKTTYESSYPNLRKDIMTYSKHKEVKKKYDEVKIEFSIDDDWHSGQEQTTVETTPKVEVSNLKSTNEPDLKYSALQKCCCCLEVPSSRKLWMKYRRDGQCEEVYGNMIEECFGLYMSFDDPEREVICDVCVWKLRDAVAFRLRMLRSQTLIQKLLERIHEKEIHIIEPASAPETVYTDNKGDLQEEMETNNDTENGNKTEEPQISIDCVTSEHDAMLIPECEMIDLEGPVEGIDDEKFTLKHRSSRPVLCPKVPKQPRKNRRIIYMKMSDLHPNTLQELQQKHVLCLPPDVQGLETLNLQPNAKENVSEDKQKENRQHNFRLQPKDFCMQGRKMICAYCGDRCMTYMELVRHVQTLHYQLPHSESQGRCMRRGVDYLVKEGRYCCLHCGNVFTQNTIYKHVYSDHADQLEASSSGADQQRLVLCDVCGYQADSPFALNAHMRSHQKKGYRENNKDRLDRTDSRLQCEVCGRRFMKSNNLNMHYYKMHSEIRHT